MARPKSKAELLSQVESNFDKLLVQLSNVPEKLRDSEFPIGTLNRSISDVYMHLHHWHLLFFSWYEEGMNDGKPAIPAEGFTWKTTPELNRKIQNMYASILLEDSLIS